jgi:hypothetical protein
MPQGLYGENIFEVHDFTVQNEQIFHFKNTYTYLWEWMRDEGFEGIYDDIVTTDDQRPRVEFYYNEKRPEPGSREIRIWWRTAKVPNDNQFIRYRIDFWYELLHLRKTEVLFEGRKATADDGEMLLNVKTYIEVDYNKMWQDHPFLKLFWKYFRRRIFLKNLYEHKAVLLRLSTRLQEDIKKLLELQTYEKVPERFHVQRGL